MPDTKSILVLTQDEKLLRHLRPMDQWLNLHAPAQPIQALETVREYHPDLFLIDANILNPMVIALITALRNVPKYSKTPVIVLGDSHHLNQLRVDMKMPADLTLRRIEKAIADLLQIKLVGRGSHGPHRGSVY